MNIRLCVPFFLLVLHEAIRDHLAFRRQLFSSKFATYIVDEDAEQRLNDNRNTDVEMLEKLERQSVDVLLHTTRGQNGMFKVSPVQESKTTLTD